jgi:thiol-disulfide isomerase/thioredoxin
MKRLLALLTPLTLAILLAGCSESNAPSNVPSDVSKDLKVYFYYSPNCPSCQQVMPYMNLLSSEVKEVKFDFCNVKSVENCSIGSIAILNAVKLKYIPTAVVRAGESVYVLVGSDEVLRLSELLEEHGIAAPDAVYKNTTYNVEECIACHEKMKIPPPSRYRCTYCCHMG